MYLYLCFSPCCWSPRVWDYPDARVSLPTTRFLKDLYVSNLGVVPKPSIRPGSS
jgi:hypothetical protein